MQLEFNPKNDHFYFHSPFTPGITLLDGIAWVRFWLESGRSIQLNIGSRGINLAERQVQDAHGLGRQLEIRQAAGPEGLELTYRVNEYAHQPFVLMQISIRNTRREPIYLQDFCLLQAAPEAGGKVDFPGRAGGLRFFKVGWHGWAYSGLRYLKDRNPGFIINLLTGSSYSNPVTPRPGKAGEFWSEGWGILANNEYAIVAGFVSTAHQFGQVYSRLRPGEEALQLSTQLDGIRLDPGEEKESEWGFLQLVTLPNPEPAVDFVQAVSRQMVARVPASPPKPMWTHWYHFYHNITEQLFLQNLAALVDLRPSLPFETVELDDGYQSAWGDWTSTNKKFPHGLSQLAENISSKGLTPGLWLAPFAAHSRSQLAHQHPEWLVKDRRGKPIRAGFFYNMRITSLDASHPAVLDHIRELMSQVSGQWGYRMIKADFLNTAALPGQRYNPKLTRAECLRLGLEAIRAGMGEGAFLLGCGCPFGPAIGIVDAMRIGPDTAPSWEPYFHWLPAATPLIKKETSMPSLRNAVRHTLNLNTLHRRWWWNDPDCLLVRDQDTKLSEEEVKSAVTLVGLSGGMLVSSDDLRSLNRHRLEWLSLLVPNLGLRGLPLDWLEHEMPGLIHVPMPEKNGLGQEWHLVGLFNWRDHPAKLTLPLRNLRLDSNTTLHGFDFWNKTYLPITQPEITFINVPPHGCKLLRISSAGDAPTLVGDTLHIAQGVEIAQWQVGKGGLSMETIDFERIVSGELWLSMPERPSNVTINRLPVEIKETSPHIFKLPLKFDGTGRLEVIY